MKTTESNETMPEITEVDLSKALILNGNTLEPQPEYKCTAVEKPFKQDEFLELICQNNKTLFGENTLIVDGKSHSLPFSMLLDYTNIDLIVLYFLDISRSKADFFSGVFPRITKILMFLNSRDSGNMILDCISANINENKALKKELNGLVEGGKIVEYLREAAIKRSFVLHITENERAELPGISNTYYEWQSVKQIQIKKYADNGKLFVLMTPRLEEIGNEKSKKRKPEGDKPKKTTEDEHLMGVNDNVRELYLKIRTEILQFDSGVQFKPASLYIAMRKNKNLAFFKMGKQKISLVVVNPEEETRKMIKHHEIKTLTEKVQAFWNGPSCTIIIENMEHVSEIIALLKKMIKEPGREFN